MKHEHDIAYPLYDGRWEHDACGTGFLASVSGEASHTVVVTALEALARLTHRGAQDADAETYDGAGILTQLPGKLLLEELERQQITVANPAGLAVGMIFLPSTQRSPDVAQESRKIIEQTFINVGLDFLGWRNPPSTRQCSGRGPGQPLPPSCRSCLPVRPNSPLS